MTTPLPLTPLATDPGVHVLTLEPNQGPMVVLDHALIQRLEATLQLVPSTATGMILASGSSRVFVAGADLKQIESLDVPHLENYLAFGQRVFGMIARLACPTVAAINGAALGGGLELAMHCDALIAARPPQKDGQPGRPYPVGLPEAGLSICPGWGGTVLLPARMEPGQAIRRTAEGKPMNLDEAIAAGMFDAVAESQERLLPTCAAWIAEHRSVHGQRQDGQPLRWAGRNACRNTVTAALVKTRGELPGTEAAAACASALQAGLEHGWSAALQVERRELNRLRHTPAGRGAIRAFFEKSAAKG
ncbi:MAG: enoyl-CoA hydratase/isomerase family protein [Phycisphaerales bacterium]